jgi:hypothetical protein
MLEKPDNGLVLYLLFMLTSTVTRSCYAVERMGRETCCSLVLDHCKTFQTPRSSLQQIRSDYRCRQEAIRAFANMCLLLHAASPPLLGESEIVGNGSSNVTNIHTNLARLDHLQQFLKI